MIKRIIFDLDNTLIPFPKNFEKGYEEVLKKYNLDITPIDLYNLIGEYETMYDYYDYELLINLINSRLNTNFDKSFLDTFMDIYDNLEIELEEGVIETLKYLNKKYSLVILTNWFTKSQENRMKKVDIFKYFDEVYGADLVKSKPNKESFIKAMGDCKIEECVVVGDSIEMDIKPATELGIKAYLYGSNDKYECIDKINDLMEVL